MTRVHGGEGASLGALLRAQLAYPLPAGVGWSHVSGSLLITLFGVQLTTGALLALYYSPSVSEAYDSIRFIEAQVAMGGFIRGLHHFAAMSFIPLAALHLLHVFWCGAYKGPRRWTWVVGCLLFACLLGFGFTGYLLPWDLKAYFGTRVGVEIAGSVPVVGEAVRRLLAGGEAVGPLTLPRFFAVHAVILPLVFTLLLLLHLFLVRLHGITPGAGAKGLSGERFHPHQTFRDALAGLVLVLVLATLALNLGAPLAERADPSNTSYVPRPEWYFLGAQQLLRMFQGRFEILGSFVIPSLAGVLLLAWPWIDRNPSLLPRERPLALAFAALSTLCMVALIVMGASAIEDEELQMEERLAAQAARSQDEAGEASPPPAEDDAELRRVGAQLYQQLACGLCHDPDSAGRALGAPGMELAGSRSPRSFTTEYLLAPTRLRYGEGGELPSMRMPDYLLEESEARALALHLEELTDSTRVPPLEVALTPLDLEEERNARILYEDFGCADCHRLDGEGEAVGPDLDGVGSRRHGAYLHAILLDPEGVIPDTSMDTYGISNEEVMLLTRLLASLK